MEHANHISKTREIGVIGTYSTVNSKAYSHSLTSLKSDCSVIEIACPLFVPLIEEGWSCTHVAKKIARSYLEAFKDTGIDTLILGCTHYPLLKNIISKETKHITLVDSASAVAKNAYKRLQKNF